jgi:serine/threonine protein kinase
MAPESLDNREFSPATDMWSFGVLLWEMYYPNQLPHTELNSVQVNSLQGSLWSSSPHPSELLTHRGQNHEGLLAKLSLDITNLAYKLV